MQDALAVGCGGLQELGAGVAIWMGWQLAAAGGDRPRSLRRCCRCTDRALALLLDCRSPLWARCCLPASRASPTASRLTTAPERPQSRSGSATMVGWQLGGGVVVVVGGWRRWSVALAWAEGRWLLADDWLTWPPSLSPPPAHPPAWLQTVSRTGSGALSGGQTCMCVCTATCRPLGAARRWWPSTSAP